MKVFLIIFALMITSMAEGAGFQCYLSTCGAGYTAGAGCDSICDTCDTGALTLPDGYVTSSGLGSVLRKIVTVCDASSMTYSCECQLGAGLSGNADIVCADGYYGKPSWFYNVLSGTDVFTGCHACPENATCDGVGNVKPVCDAGYYSESAGAVKYVCQRCPKYTYADIYGESAAGSDDVTDCYMPNEIELQDDIGTFSYDVECHYE